MHGGEAEPLGQHLYLRGHSSSFSTLSVLEHIDLGGCFTGWIRNGLLLVPDEVN
jgi:hypothetical protein